MTTDNTTRLGASGAAKILGLATSTLAKLRLNGDGPIYCKLGRRVIYRREDLEAWLESRVARNTSDADARLPKSLTSSQTKQPAEDGPEIGADLPRAYRRQKRPSGRKPKRPQITDDGAR
jgi:hypothetical protein